MCLAYILWITSTLLSLISFVILCLIFSNYIYKFCCSEDEEFEPALPSLKKEPPKAMWEDEDVEDEDVKESWEDEEEPKQVLYFCVCFLSLFFFHFSSHIIVATCSDMYDFSTNL